MTSSFSDSFIASFSASSGGVSPWSAAVFVQCIRWEPASKSVIAVCSDGNNRVLRTARLSKRDATTLVDGLRRAIREGVPLRFCAAGRNSPDRWFCGLSL